MKRTAAGLAIACALALLAIYVDAFWIEPRMLVVRPIALAQPATVHLAHISDIHFVGDTARLQRLVDTLNRLHPDLVCFTGDLVDGRANLRPCLRILQGLQMPLYGVPGNHDYWSGDDLAAIQAAFAATGGGWLRDTSVTLADKGLVLTGWTGHDPVPSLPDAVVGPGPRLKHVLLMHFPKLVDKLQGTPYNAILAGHSHGGQIRIPGIGALIVPYAVGRYDRGLFRTPAGPLLVNVGFGTYFIAARFCCPPEILDIQL